MLPSLFALSACGFQAPLAWIGTEDTAVQVVKTGGGLQAELLTLDAKGAMTRVAVFEPGQSSFRFESLHSDASGVTMKGDHAALTLTLGKNPGVVHATVQASGLEMPLREALVGVSLVAAQPAAVTRFVPYGAGELVTRERFVTPLAAVKSGEYGLAVAPDLDDLATNLPMQPVIEVGADGRSPVGSVLRYGFKPFDRGSAWRAVPADRPLDNPSSFRWEFDVIVATSDLLARKASQHLWARYGKERSRTPLPQTVPYRYYTKPTYDMEQRDSEGPIQGLWWVSETGASTIKAPIGQDRVAKFGIDGNVSRFLYGLKWWGERLEQEPWTKSADHVLNLVVSSPSTSGRTMTAFDTQSTQWVQGPFDATAAAYDARWKLKFLDAFDAPQNAKLREQVESTAKELLGHELGGTGLLFLQELFESSAVSDASLKARVRNALDENRLRAVALAKSGAERFARPSVESVSLALFLAKANVGTTEAVRLVEGFFLHQALWQPETADETKVFGAFVGEHYSEESQSLYTSDLLEAVVLLGMEDYAPRAVSALRAPLALFAHSTHGISGLRVPSSIGSYRSSAWYGLNGQSQFGPWRGVAEGIGQTLTSLAASLDKFGSYYTHSAGWTVPIDGLAIVDGKPFSAFSLNPYAFDGVFPYDHVDHSQNTRTSGRDPEALSALRSIGLQLMDGTPVVVALLGMTVIDAPNRLKGDFVFGDGSRRAAQFLPTGLGTTVSAELLESGGVSFEGTLSGQRLTARKTYLSVGPPKPELGWPRGWKRTGELADVIASSLKSGQAMALSTSDDGRGNRNEALTGTIESVPFLLSQNGVRLRLIGEVSSDVYVELVDLQMGIPVASVQKQKEGAEEFTLELNDVVGRTVYVRIVDQSRKGSIDVLDLRQERVGL